jgi:hypothetical protein
LFVLVKNEAELVKVIEEAAKSKEIFSHGFANLHSIYRFINESLWSRVLEAEAAKKNFVYLFIRSINHRIN